MIVCKNLFFGCIILSVHISLSQIANIQDNSPSYQLTNTSDMAFMSIRIVSSGKDTPSGSYYLNEDFLPGTILFHATKKKIIIPVRYNAAANEIEVKRKDNIVAITPIKAMEVLYGEKLFVSVKNPKVGKPIFVQKLVGGKYKLYDFFKVKINKAPSDASLLNLEQKDEIEIKPNLYFQIEEGDITSLPTRKKEVDRFFKSSELDFLKREKLNLKKKDDAVEFFLHLNSK